MLGGARDVRRRGGAAAGRSVAHRGPMSVIGADAPLAEAGAVPVAVAAGAVPVAAAAARPAPARAAPRGARRGAIDKKLAFDSVHGVVLYADETNASADFGNSVFAARTDNINFPQIARGDAGVTADTYVIQADDAFAGFNFDSYNFDPLADINDTRTLAERVISATDDRLYAVPLDGAAAATTWYSAARNPKLWRWFCEQNPAREGETPSVSGIMVDGGTVDLGYSPARDWVQDRDETEVDVLKFKSTLSGDADTGADAYLIFFRVHSGFGTAWYAPDTMFNADGSPATGNEVANVMFINEIVDRFGFIHAKSGVDLTHALLSTASGEGPSKYANTRTFYTDANGKYATYINTRTVDGNDVQTTVFQTKAVTGRIVPLVRARRWIPGPRATTVQQSAVPSTSDYSAQGIPTA